MIRFETPARLRVRTTILFTSLSLAPLGACDDPDCVEDLVEFRDNDGTYSCPRWQCGYNTSEINGKSLTELNLDGQANAAGVSLAGFSAPLGLLGYELDVDGDSLVAHGPGLFGSTLRGAELIGSTLWIDTGELLDIPVVIAGYEQVASWATGSPAVDAYALIYDDLDLELTQSVCKGTLIDPLQAAVVILAGETYDPVTKAVIPGQDRWITLACAGSATAKAALLGYGPHGDLGGQGPASVDQRQASLNMITANYCGDGTSYTQDGTPLLWENVGGTVVPDQPLGAREAIWTAAGAICLDTPRIVDPGDVACQLPSCAGFVLGDGEWITHSPAN